MSNAEPQVWLVVPDDEGNFQLVARTSERDVIAAVYDRCEPSRWTQAAKVAWDAKVKGLTVKVLDGH